MRSSVLASAVLAAGCASGSAATSAAHPDDPLFHLDAGRDTVARAADPAPPGPSERLAYALDVQFVHSEGTTVAAPRILIFPGQRANVQVLRQTAYIEGFSLERKAESVIADPVVAILQEGFRLEVRAAPAAGDPDRISLAFQVRTADAGKPFPTRTFPVADGAPEITLQLPAVVRAEAEGVRVLDSGVTSLLARVPAGDGSGDAVTILARVARAGVPPDELEGRTTCTPTDGEQPPAILALAGEATGAPGRLRLRPILLRRAIPVGTVLDEIATEALLAEEGPVPLQDLHLVTAWTPGIRIARLLEESRADDYNFESSGTEQTGTPVVHTCTTGIEGTVAEDGRLRITWSRCPAVCPRFETDLGPGHVVIDLPERDATSISVRPVARTRLAALVRTRDGGTAAVLFEFAPVEGPAVLPARETGLVR